MWTIIMILTAISVQGLSAQAPASAADEAAVKALIQRYVDARDSATPDVAIADGNYDISGIAVRRWTTMVLKREAAGWRIAAIRNMVATGGSQNAR